LDKPDAEADAKLPQLRCTLTSVVKSVRRGDQFNVRMVIENDGFGFVCFNPWLQPRIRKPVRLILSTDDGAVIGDLLDSSLVKSRGERPQDFVYLPGGALLGVDQKVKAFEFRTFAVNGAGLPAGKYRLQAQFDSSFSAATADVFSTDPQAASAAVSKALLKPKQNVLRSNVLRIELLD